MVTKGYQKGVYDRITKGTSWTRLGGHDFLIFAKWDALSPSSIKFRPTLPKRERNADIARSVGQREPSLRRCTQIQTLSLLTILCGFEINNFAGQPVGRVLRDWAPLGSRSRIQSFARLGGLHHRYALAA